MTDLIRPTTQDDIEFIAENIRKEDAEECEAAGFSPAAGLALSKGTSIVCKTLLTPDTLQPGAVMGVCPGFSPSWGAIWLLGTDDIKRYRVPFLRRSRQVLADLYDETRMEAFYNYSYVGNSVHHAWLRWLGFTFLRKVPLHNGHEFYEFVKIKG